MPLPSNYNITTYQGDTFDLVVTLLDENGDPVDLTDAVFTLQVRNKVGSEVLLEIAQGDGITYVGNIVTISKEVTVEEGQYRYDLEAVFPTRIRTYLYGEFAVVGDITRDE